MTPLSLNSSTFYLLCNVNIILRTVDYITLFLLDDNTFILKVYGFNYHTPFSIVPRLCAYLYTFEKENI